MPTYHATRLNKTTTTATYCTIKGLKAKLDNVAVNDVLPLKATRRDAIANVKCFGAPEHQRPNFDGFIYIR